MRGSLSSTTLPTTPGRCPRCRREGCRRRGAGTSAYLENSVRQQRIVDVVDPQVVALVGQLHRRQSPRSPRRAWIERDLSRPRLLVAGALQGKEAAGAGAGT